MSGIEHPIKMYIKKDLAMTVEQFGQVAAIPQSTLATWIRRERPVEKLPIEFYAALAKTSNRSIDAVYNDLLRWQQRYMRYKQESLLQTAEEKPLFSMAAQEVKAVFLSFKKEQRTANLITPAKTMRKSLDDNKPQIFLETIIQLYATIDRILPIWMTQVLDGEGKFKEIGTAFYNELLIK